MACVEDRRVRFPAVAALARAHVAPFAAGGQNVANVKMLPIAKSNTNWELATLILATLAILATFFAMASPAPLSSGNRPHFHGDSSRFRVPRARPGRRRTSASAACRLACACGADAARCCRLAPPRPRIRRAMRPTSASVRLAGPRARSAQPLHAPRIFNRKVLMQPWCGEIYFLQARTNVANITHRILIAAVRQGRCSRLAAAS